MPNWTYIALLTAFIGAAVGYVYAGSEVKTIQVTGKHVEDGQGRRGLPTERLIVKTDDGELPILKFPIIGYTLGANEAYKRLPSRGEVTVRVGMWPPAIVARFPKPHILHIYDTAGQGDSPQKALPGPNPSAPQPITVHLVPLGD